MCSRVYIYFVKNWVCLHVCISVYQCVHLYVCLSIYVSILTCNYIRLSIYLSIYLSVCLYVCLSACLNACLHLHISLFWASTSALICCVRVRTSVCTCMYVNISCMCVMYIIHNTTEHVYNYVYYVCGVRVYISEIEIGDGWLNSHE